MIRAGWRADDEETNEHDIDVTLVRERRNATPWASMNLHAFMHDMALNGQALVSLTCVYRPDVASRFWWTVEWTDEQGEKHEASAQELDLCLWRAAEKELQARQRIEKKGDDNGKLGRDDAS